MEQSEDERTTSNKKSGGGPGRARTKRCRVCGDQALGYNFDAITCESCKAFFRRNALKSDSVRCAYDDHCDVSISSRRSCQKCRLKKCFQVGMKSGLISSGSDSQHKRRSKTNSRPTQKCVTSSIDSSTSSPMSFIERLLDEDDRCVKKILVIPIYEEGNERKCVCTCTCGALPPGSKLKEKQKRTEDKGVNTNTVGGDVATSSRFFTNPCMNDAYVCDLNSYATAENIDDTTGASPMSLSLQMDRVWDDDDDVTNFGCRPELSAAQRALLDELVLANSVMNEPVDNFLPTEKTDNRTGGDSLADFVNLMDIATRRLIVMAKRLGAFVGLRQEAQIGLLKGGWLELLVLRGVMAFDADSDAWLAPRAHRISNEPLRGISSDVYAEYKSYFHSFNRKLRSNETVMLVLCAITLFMPTRPNLADTAQVKSVQDDYVRLLRKYLYSTYSMPEAREALEHLQRRMEQLRRVTLKVVRIFSLVNHEQVKPLLLEMFDLKTNQ